MRNVLVVIKRDVLSLPVCQRRLARRHLKIEHAPITMAWECRSTTCSTSQSNAASAPASSGTPDARLIHSEPANLSAPFNPPIPENRSATPT